ncbi:DNRLRE domain-containing protein, partial [bacterium]|nr:DNRLRE domain-containing protein [candidate division CSSED10-310 bacterium]
FVGDMIPSTIRKFGQRSELALLGVAVAQADDIEEYAAPDGCFGELPDRNAGNESGKDRRMSDETIEMEGFPDIPIMPMKYSSSTTSYTPPPNTPTPTPKPTVQWVLSSVADAMVDNTLGQTNFGDSDTLMIEPEPLKKQVFIKFPIPRKKAGQTFDSALLKLHRRVGSWYPFMYRISKNVDAWWEDNVTADNQPGDAGWSFSAMCTSSDATITIPVNEVIRDAWLNNERYLTLSLESSDEIIVFDSKENASVNNPVRIDITVTGDFGSSQSPPATPTPIHHYYIQCPTRADSYTSRLNPDTQYGSADFLRLQGRDGEAWVRYWLPAVEPQQVVSADVIFRVISYPALESAINVYRITDRWDEMTITHTGRPASDPVLHDWFLEERSGWELMTISELVRTWLTDPAEEYGIRLTSWDYYGLSMDEAVTLCSREWDSPPYLMLRLNSVAELVDIDLRLSQNQFVAGDRFEMDVVVANYREIPVHGQLWLILDVYGQYWFFPSWTPSPECVLRSFTPNALSVETMLSFTWPDDCGQGFDIKFWTGFIDDLTGDISYDWVAFGWQ